MTDQGNGDPVPDSDSPFGEFSRSLPEPSPAAPNTSQPQGNASQSATPPAQQSTESSTSAPDATQQADDISAPDYVLGIDLGTSHTVAVVRWPDGRCRPLLVDGAPVMPSAVFLDEAGHIHIGRDAQRLAQTDPTRYEPNPKQRIDEGTILLGDREVSTTALLAGVLREVASKAVEAVGKLPPAVLTCPAKWGPNRRAVLQDAAAQAGFPPVELVPEPVAAAHYFAEVMKQPIPMGKSVAVFDFGGGTLDVAVVKHAEDGTFAVRADGGLDDLGGLDVDAALVEHLGRTIHANAPQLWQQLSQPVNGYDRRNRRTFWEDVRGAKEMLSRTTVAPLPVPTVEVSLHLTREELERLATPLLRRAVEETQRVIAMTGQSPDQLAGLFLVGGASRIPLVARVLHAALGIAPTVLEQPELPVAEGALAAAAADTGPVSEGDTQVMRPAPQEGFLPAGEEPPPWYRRKTWIAAAALLLVAVLGAAWLLYDPYPQHDMDQLEEVGEVAFPGGDDSNPDVLAPRIRGDSAYFGATNADDEMIITAVDLTTAQEEWSTDKITHDGYGWEALWGKNNMLYAQIDRDMEADELVFVDPDGGEVGDSAEVGGAAEQYIIGDTLVSRGSSSVTAYDNTGNELWRQEPGIEMEAGNWVQTWSDYTQPNGDVDSDSHSHMWASNAKGDVVILDVADGGQTVSQGRVGDENSTIAAYEDRLYVMDNATSPTLAIYDVEDLSSPISEEKIDNAGSPRFYRVCGQELMCVLGDTDDDNDADRVSFMDVGGGGIDPGWQSPQDQEVEDVEVAGETIAVTRAAGDGKATQLYDANGEKIGEESNRGGFQPIDSGSFLNFPSGGDPEKGAESFQFDGLGARDGTGYALGSQEVRRLCTANSTYLACATDNGYKVWRFR